MPERLPRRRWRILAPAAAAATVLLIVGGIEAGVGSVAARPPTHSRTAAAGPAVSLGGFPTGIVLDPATRTIYIGGGGSSVAMVNAATCNASVTSGCAHVTRANTAGRDPIGVAVNDRTRTLYVVNGGANTVAVFSTATCNAVTSSGATGPLPWSAPPAGRSSWPWTSGRTPSTWPAPAPARSR